MRAYSEEACGQCERAESHRIYCCGRCRRLVVICSRCDRGNIYCSAGCAKLSRQETNCRSGRRYQQSSVGRTKHADRQAAYRKRVREKVTQQGSAPPPLLPTEDRKQVGVAALDRTAVVVVEPQDNDCIDLESTALGLGSAATTPRPGSLASPASLEGAVSPLVHRQSRCDFCGRRCGVYSRNGFLTRRR